MKEYLNEWKYKSIFITGRAGFINFTLINNG